MIRDVPFFEFLINDHAAVTRIADAIVSVKYQAGEFIFREGDEGTAFYVLHEGEVNITKTFEIEADPSQANERSGGSRGRKGDSGGNNHNNNNNHNNHNRSSKASKEDSSAEIILKRLHRGDTFGETALNDHDNEHGVRSASALVQV